jgi:hypothetical protein
MSRRRATSCGAADTVRRVAEWGASRRRRAIGAAEVGPRRAPVRLVVVAIVGLAIASVLSFPTVGAAQPAPPAGLRAAVLTPDGTDGYVLTDGTDRITAAAASGNTGGNLRLLFWPSEARIETDATSCATWSAATSDILQQGAALRVSVAPGGTVRAITVTKNVYVHSYWIFNIHVWNSADGLGREIASFDLGSVFRFSNDLYVARPLPWRLCARTRDGRVEFKVWRLAELEPAWGDPAHGGSVAIPEDAPASGASGWFIGHMRPGMSATFTDLHAHPRVAPPTVPGAVAAQDLAPTAAQ